MQTASRRCLVATVALLSVAWSGDAGAQNRIPTTPSFTSLPELGPVVRKARKPDVKAKGRPIPEAKIAKPPPKQPIAFVPFTLEDLARATNRKGLKLDDVVELPGSSVVRRYPGVPDSVLSRTPPRRMTAREALKEANELEQSLAGKGQSLRDRAPTVVLSTRVPRTKLDAQRAMVLKKVQPMGAKRAFVPLRLQDVERLQAARTGRSTAIVSTATSTARNSSQANLALPEQVWTQPFGDPDILGAELEAKLTFEGTPERVETHASARATGFLFGLQKDFVVLSAEAIGGNGGTVNNALNLTMTVLGDDLVTPVAKLGTGRLDAGEVKDFSVSPSTELPFWLGPIPVSVTVGAIGTVGFRYNMVASPLFSTVVAEPFATLDAYAEAGIGSDAVAEVGAGGHVVLIDENLELSALLEIDDASGAPRYQWSYGAYNEFETLAGSLYAFARVNYFFGSKEWQVDLFEWDGIKFKDYLFHESRSQDFNGVLGAEVPEPKGTYRASCTGCQTTDTMLRCSCTRDDGGAQDASLRMPCGGWVVNHDGALQCLPDGDYLGYPLALVPKQADVCGDCFLQRGLLGCSKCPQSSGGKTSYVSAALTAPCGVARLGRDAKKQPNGTLECAAPPPPSPPCPSGTTCCPVSAQYPDVCMSCLPQGMVACWPNLSLRVGPVAAAAANALVRPASASSGTTAATVQPASPLPATTAMPPAAAKVPGAPPPAAPAGSQSPAAALATPAAQAPAATQPAAVVQPKPAAQAPAAAKVPGATTAPTTVKPATSPRLPRVPGAR